MVLRRFRGKQHDPKCQGQDMEPQESSVRRKAKKATELQVATQAGLVPKAPRPFALYCKMTGQSVKLGSQSWKLLSLEEKMKYVSKSKDLFADQRRHSVTAGVRVRERQVRGTELAKAVSERKSHSGMGAFAAFCKQSGQTLEKASLQWKGMAEKNKEKFRAMAKESSLRGTQQERNSKNAEFDYGTNVEMQLEDAFWQ